MIQPQEPLASPGATPSRLSGSRLVWVFGGVLAAILIIAVIVIAGSGPGDPKPPCSESVLYCPDPPQGRDRESEPPSSTFPSTALAFTRGTIWRSTELGYEVDYDPEIWTVTRESGTDLVLQDVNGDYKVLFEGRRADAWAPTQLFEARLEIIRRSSPDLTLDTDAYDAIPGAHIGYIDADGGSYIGTATGTDGVPTTPAGYALFVATDARLTILFMMVVDQPDVLIDEESTRQYRFRSYGDALLKDFRWSARR